MIKTVGIEQLKLNLSAYLRDVRRGCRVLVFDRNTVVAEIHDPRARYAPSALEDPVLAQWIAVVPTRPKQKVPLSLVRSKRGSVHALLDADRGESPA